MIVTNAVAALVLGLTIFVCYGIAQAWENYDFGFNMIMLFMTVVISTLVSFASRNNYALIATIAVLAIIGLVKASRDKNNSKCIFWCISVGICCGMSEYLYIGVACLLIFTFSLIKRAIEPKDLYTVKIRTGEESRDDVKIFMKKSFRGRARLIQEKCVNNSYEIVYLMTENMTKKWVKGQHFRQALYMLDMVTLVSIDKLDVHNETIESIHEQ